MINERGSILVKDKMDTEAYKGGPEILKKVISIVADYMDTYEPSGIAISTAGMVDVEKGEIFYSAPLIPNYAGIQFKKVLEKKFGIPCEVENDVNCAGLAESVSGAGVGSSVTLCLTIGTGIGGCILIDGHVFHGYSNSACEVGYMNMLDSDFQTLGATSILTKRVAARKEECEEKWEGYHIFEAAKDGDKDCILDGRGTWQRNRQYLLCDQSRSRSPRRRNDGAGGISETPYREISEEVSGCKYCR